ncbi:vacuolar protein sorting-associated protein [Blastocystis sp. ATCC 50177/Nand II]|uniref:Vacuolar protein sorting-associated protein n=1 Tax=Blastocystis sp. subtype 1 (strain ATCC 50177 / NandII) TaxID=478820 RepID=A0A196SI06_BLAHN|nr:vacuolar protein sorting-associated protein [Blastocystis sp. ATCC 50177/Nand II]
MEDDLEPMDAMDYREEDASFGSSEEEEEEVIDYEGMKSALEMFQKADIVKEALEKGVDLVEYEKKVEEDLASASASSIDDYLAASKHFAELHKDMNSCDGLLAQMQELLHLYQKDLSGVANEIRTLQNQSLALSQKLQNRRNMDGVIRGLVNKIAINPNMVKVLIEGGINEDYVHTLHKLDAQLDFVNEDVENEELHVKTSEIKAVNEVKADLAILKSQSGSRVRDFLLEKLRLITPEANLEEIQKSELLPQAPMMLFLKKHIPKTFEELKRQYMGSVKEMLLNRVKAFREQLQPHEMAVGSAEDLLVHTQGYVKSFFKKTQKTLREYTTEGFELAGRNEVLKHVADAPMTVEPLQEGDDADMDAVVCWRSLLRLVMDLALAEYAFDRDFFHAEDTAIFSEIFAGVCKYVQAQLGEWAAASVDFFGVLLVGMLVQSLLTQLQNSEYPILVDFWLPLE